MPRWGCGEADCWRGGAAVMDIAGTACCRAGAPCTSSASQDRPGGCQWLGLSNVRADAMQARMSYRQCSSCTNVDSQIVTCHCDTKCEAGALKTSLPAKVRRKSMLICRAFILPGTACRECDELVMYVTACLGDALVLRKHRKPHYVCELLRPLSPLCCVMLDLHTWEASCKARRNICGLFFKLDVSGVQACCMQV